MLFVAHDRQLFNLKNAATDSVKTSKGLILAFDGDVKAAAVRGDRQQPDDRTLDGLIDADVRIHINVDAGGDNQVEDCVAVVSVRLFRGRTTSPI